MNMFMRERSLQYASSIFGNFNGFHINNKSRNILGGLHNNNHNYHPLGVLSSCFYSTTPKCNNSNNNSSSSSSSSSLIRKPVRYYRGGGSGGGGGGGGGGARRKFKSFRSSTTTTTTALLYEDNNNENNNNNKNNNNNSSNNNSSAMDNIEFSNNKPTIAYAKSMPLSFSSLSHDLIVSLSAEGILEAREEALIRNIMAVNSIPYDDAVIEFQQIAKSNRNALFWHYTGHHLGIGTALGGAVLSIPMIFHYPTVSWFNESYVTADVPEPKDIETWLEVGSFSWSWMEPLIGEISFLLLAIQMARTHMTILGIHPVTQYLRRRRAMMLVRSYPQYDPKLVADFSKCDTLYR